MHTVRLARRGLATLAIVTALAAAAFGSPAPAAEHVAPPCSSVVSHSVIPVWGRAGFSEPKPRVTHVIGRSDSILAILFGGTLHSPPARDRSNKILWVARRATGLGAMYIRAQQMRGTQLLGQPVSRVVQGGPGPSTVNVPAAGCWRFTITWKTGRDTLDLRYAAHS